MPKLTKRLVEDQRPESAARFVWDTDVKGFGLKVFPSGAKAFVFQYRTQEGRTRRLTIGKLSDTLTADAARKIAKIKLGEVLNGADPQGDKRARREALTLDMVFDDYLQSDAFKGKADSTQATDKGRINRHLRPLLGSMYADKLTTADVRRMVKDIAAGKTAGKTKTKARGLARVSGGAGTAKKAFTLLRAIYKWVDGDAALPASTVEWSKIKTAPDGRRDAIIESAADYGRLFRTLDKMQNEKRIRDAVADAIRVIALTGARRGEIAGLRWSYIDLRNGRIILPAKAHKSGHKSGKNKVLMLPAQAQAIIARQLSGEADDFVFAPASGVGPICLSGVWRKVRAEAGLSNDIGLHNLRHSVGSHLAMGGASLVEIQAQLGHSDAASSQRYIHFAEQARSTLAERAAAVAVAGLEGKDDVAPVTRLPRAAK